MSTCDPLNLASCEHVDTRFLCMVVETEDLPLVWPAGKEAKPPHDPCLIKPTTEQIPWATVKVGEPRSHLCHPYAAIWADIHSGCTLMVVQHEGKFLLRLQHSGRWARRTHDPILINPSTTHMPLTIDMVGVP